MTTLTMYSVCTFLDVPAVQGLLSELLLNGLLSKKWIGLAWWFKSPIPTDSGLKWNSKLFRQLLHWRGEGFWDQSAKPTTAGLKSKAVAASWRTDQLELNTWARYGYSITLT